MLVAIVARDKPGHLEVRKTNREAHLDYGAASGKVVLAGPLLDAGGEMCGSLIVLEVETMADAEAWAAGDPYVKAGLFASVEINAWKKVIG